tara:strand:- start:1467 stop:3308 length:1842 start_codon:yes stop_codon:yes gene_type:complete
MITRLRFELLYRFGFPDLWLLWPVTIMRVLKAASLSAYVLSSFEFWTRPYYERISRDFRSVGRWGYVWDESLGIPFGPRIYNNTATYAIYGALSPRAFRVLTLAAYLCAVIVLGHAAGNAWPAFAVALLLLGSPAALHSLFSCMLKPEIMWWPVALIALGACMIGAWWVSLAAGGLLLLVNAPVATLAALLVAPVWIHDAMRETTLPGNVALLFLLPGILKNVIRVLQAREDSFGSAAAQEQRRVTEIQRITLREIANLVLWFVVPLLLAGYPFGIVAALPGMAALIIWLINRRLVKVADSVTIQMVFMTVLVATTNLSQNWASLAGIVLFAFYQPFLSYSVIRGEREANEFRSMMNAPAAARLQFLRQTSHMFPWFTPVSDPSAGPVLTLLDTIPDGSRILMESDGDGRHGSAYLHFRNWADKTVSRRHIEIVNHFFLLRIVDQELAERYLDRFSVSRQSVEKMSELCSVLGVSHVMAFSTETANALRANGYSTVAVVQKEQTEKLSDVMHMPNTAITLFAAPGHPSLIEPTVRASKAGNRLKWRAVAGRDYLIRYRFHKDFVATQEANLLAVEPAPVLPDLPLRFIRVKALHTGEITLEFKTRWWNRLGLR